MYSPLRRLAGRIGTTSLVLAGLVTVGTPSAVAAPLSPCVDPDNGTPRLHAIAFEPSAVDVTKGARDVTVRVNATDAGGPGPASGLWTVSVKVDPPSGGPVWEYDVELSRASGDEWTGVLTVPAGAKPGEWTIGGVSLADHAGNYLEDVDAEGYDFLAPFDDVRLDVSSDADNTAPRATMLKLSKKSINTHGKARKVNVRVDVTDDRGVAGVHVVARSNRGDVAAQLTPKSATRFAGKLYFPKKSPRAKYRIEIIRVTDEAGKERAYRRKQVAALGKRTFGVNGPADAKPPSLMSAVVKPKKIDVRRDRQKVRVRAWLRDTGTGVRSAHVSLYDAWDVAMKRKKGNARKGLWVGTFDLDPCSVFQSRAGTIRIHDRAGNVSVEDFGGPRVKRNDNLPPDARSNSNRVDAEGPVSLRFTEPVNGIHDGSITIRRMDWPSPLGDPHPGAWTCADPDGDATGCENGPVLTATWAPDTPLEPGDYRVQVNPDGVLSVTDLAGNPVNRDAEEPGDYFDVRVE